MADARACYKMAPAIGGRGLVLRPAISSARAGRKVRSSQAMRRVYLIRGTAAPAMIVMRPAATLPIAGTEGSSLQEPGSHLVPIMGLKEAANRGYYARLGNQGRCFATAL